MFNPMRSALRMVTSLMTLHAKKEAPHHSANPQHHVRLLTHSQAGTIAYITKGHTLTDRVSKLAYNPNHLFSQQSQHRARTMTMIFNDEAAYTQATKKLKQARSILQLLINSEYAAIHPINRAHTLWLLQDCMMHAHAALGCLVINDATWPAGKRTP